MVFYSFIFKIGVGLQMFECVRKGLDFSATDLSTTIIYLAMG